MSTELPEKLLDIDEDSMEERETDPEEQEEVEERERFVVFDLGAEQYAVDVQSVRSVVEIDDYTRVPRSSDAIEGVMDLRGNITAIIDPHVHFEIDTDAVDPSMQRVLVFDRPADKQGAGIRVDRVTGVESIPVSRIFRTPLPEEGVEEAHLEHDLVRAVISTPNGDDFERVTLIDAEAVVQNSGE